jgi:hypothetical protein
VPAELPPPAPPDDDVTLFGLAAEPAEEPGEASATAADAEPLDEGRILVLRRPDGVAGALLLVAGAAGCLSLFLPWARQGEQLGVTLVRLTFELGWRERDQVLRTGLLLPLGVAAGGVVLLLLGMLAFRPAATHRVTGVLALAVALAVGGGVVVRMAGAGSIAVLSDPGVLCAVVVAGVGLLGALKAMLTVPAVTAEPA